MAWSDIPGRAAYLWIYDEFLKAAPRGAHVVEVGVALGKSIAYLAERCIVLGRSDVRITAVDAWAGVARNGEQQAMAKPEEDFELFHRMMREHAPDALNRIAVVRKWSVDAAAMFDRHSVDLVVLDADHTYAAVRADLDAWIPVLREGGWIGGDDYMPEYYQGLIDAVHETWPRERVEVRHAAEWSDWGTWLVRA